MSIATVDVRGFSEAIRVDNRIPIVDVRTPGEFQSLHVHGAINVPLDQLSVERIVAVADGKGPVYIICQSGARGERACQQLASSGIDVINVAGGTNACVEAGMAIVRGKGVISIDRQVRIAAGSLVLMGVLLGWMIHPAFYGLSAFIGAGLVFAGVSNTCGMAMLLATMPWNRTGHATGVATSTNASVVRQ